MDPNVLQQEKPVHLRSLSHFLDELGAHESDWSNWFYRGHSNVKYRLIPKAGRSVFSSVSDEKMLKVWRRHALPFLTTLPRQLTNWDMIAIAQHHGLATRLLDWTSNAFAAAFFATVSADGTIDEDNDGAVVAHHTLREPITTEDVDPGEDPFAINELRRVRPSSVVPRIVRQGGIFTIHNPPATDLMKDLPDGHRLQTFIIPRSLKKTFASKLSHLSINQMQLFPDLDGLSKHINWTFITLPPPPIGAPPSSGVA